MTHLCWPASVCIMFRLPSYSAVGHAYNYRSNPMGPRRTCEVKTKYKNIFKVQGHGFFSGFDARFWVFLFFVFFFLFSFFLYFRD